MGDIFTADEGIVEIGVEDVAFGTQSTNMSRVHQAKELPDRGNLKQAMHPSDRLRSGNHQEPGVLGHKSDSSVPLSVFLRGYKDGLPTAHPTLGSPLLLGGGSENEEIVALAHAIGQIHVSGAGAALSAVEAAPAPTTTAFAVAVGKGADYEVGAHVAVEVSAGRYESRRVLTIAVDLLTLEYPLSAAPAAGKTVYSGIDIFPTQQPQVDALSMNIQGQDNDGGDDWQHELLGLCCNALGLKWDAQGFVEANMEFDVEDWTREDAGTAPTYSADDGPERQALLGAQFTMYLTGTPSCMDASAMEFETGLNIQRPKSACAPQGVLKSRFGLAEPVMTVDPYKEEEDTWMSSTAPFRNQDGVHFTFQAGSIPGRLVVLSISNGHVNEEPVLSERDGMLINPIQVVPMVYTGDGTPGTDERNNTTPKGAPWVLTIL